MKCSGFLQLSVHLLVVGSATAIGWAENLHNTDNNNARRQTGGSGCNVETLSAVLPSSAKVERVEYVSAGSSFGEPLTDLMYPIPPTDLPELCAVIISVASSVTSAYRFGIFLPMEWNGRFLTVGNGGFGGGINWLDMGAGVKHGFAVISTDTGHNSTTGDTLWAFDNPEIRTDWGWRALHGSVQLGKTLVSTYYSKPISYSYYSGCSTGGRQGLKEIQISPNSFDGVLVGAPAWYTSHLNTWVCKIASYNWPSNEPKHIDWQLLPPIADEVVRQCDGNDGVTDGIISLPEQCNIDYDAMRCSNGGHAPSDFAASDNCLNEEQIGTLQSLYKGYVTDAGEHVLPGYLPGSESQLYTVLNYSQSSPFGLGYIRNFLLNDPMFEATQYNDSLLQLADEFDPGNATANNYNLSAFRDRGGKVVMYHGSSDGLVPTTAASLYYERAVDGTSGGNVTLMREFFRRLEVPGMQHCGYTSVDAPWAFGGASQASILGNNTYSVPGFTDSAHDILLALVDWVENGAPVDQVIATTWNDPTDSSSGVKRQRPICTYPTTATWDGSGNVDDAASWSCGNNTNSTNQPEVHSAGSRTYMNPLSVMMDVFRAMSILTSQST